MNTCSDSLLGACCLLSAEGMGPHLAWYTVQNSPCPQQRQGAVSCINSRSCLPCAGSMGHTLHKTLCSPQRSTSAQPDGTQMLLSLISVSQRAGSRICQPPSCQDHVAGWLISCGRLHLPGTALCLCDHMFHSFRQPAPS